MLTHAMKYSFSLLYFLGAFALSAQTVENVSFIQQGETVLVQYDLLGKADLLGEYKGTYEAALYYSINNGHSFYGPAKGVTGDVGKIMPAQGHSILLRPVEALEEMGGPFSVSNFIVRVQVTYTPAYHQPEMIYVKGGEFMMGSPKEEENREDDENEHSVTLSDFLFSQRKVTHGEYESFCSATGKNLPERWKSDKTDQPIIDISWYDAVAYCNWLSKVNGLEQVYTIEKLSQAISTSGYEYMKWQVTPDWTRNGYRLPTESEWEYAARLANGAMETEVKQSSTADVLRNAHLSDTIYSTDASHIQWLREGPSEWCWDWYQGYHIWYEVDPRGPESGKARVLRGGDEYKVPRLAQRSSKVPYYHTYYTGLRVVQTIPQQILDKDNLPSSLQVIEEPEFNEFIFAEKEPEALNMEDIQRLIIYPQIARDAGIQGSVVVRILVDEQGRYVKHRVINNPHPILTKAVERELEKLVFSPAIRDGKPMRFWVNIPFNFKLLNDRKKKKGQSAQSDEISIGNR